jgi:hypothetical protein
MLTVSKQSEEFVRKSLLYIALQISEKNITARRTQI